MEFRVLGPPEVLDDQGARLPVNAPRLRALLAALVLTPSRTVPVEDLAHQLWGEDLPPTVATTLRNYVARLRRVLPQERIRTAPGGYQLLAQLDETDIGRFRDGVRRARSCAAERPAHAVELLEQALAEWRGSPLAGVGDCPLRTVEQPRLEELRLSATEELFDLRLSLGQHRAVVDELITTAGQHPLREGFARQLMLALYRCGRTPDALTVYRDLRHTLVEELGIEPTSVVRQLERAILRDDPELALPARDDPPVSAAGGTCPTTDARDQTDETDESDGTARQAAKDGADDAMAGAVHVAAEEAAAVGGDTPVVAPSTGFPAALSTFVARGVELARVREWLTGGMVAPAICLVDGPGGVGKSSLAVRAAREVADRFPDGLLRVDLRGADPRGSPLGTWEALHHLLTALGVPAEAVPQDEASAMATYRRRLDGKRVLVLLDNAFSSEQIAPLLPVQPGTAAVVTSRAALFGAAGAHHVHLDVLDLPDAVHLAASVSGHTVGASDQTDWEELVSLCGGLPLALDIIATRMASRPRWGVGDWVAILRDGRSRLDELAFAERDVRTSLLVSIDQLAAGTDAADRRAATLFPLLGSAAVSTYSVPSVAALAGSELADARDAMDRLVDTRVAESPRPDTYTLHDLVRAASVQEAAGLPVERVRTALARLCHWYLGSLHRAGTHLESVVPNASRRAQDGAVRFPAGRSFPSADEAMSWTDNIVNDVLSLAEQLSAPEYDTTAGGDADAARLGDRPLSEFALECALALENYFVIRHSWTPQENMSRTALRVAERRRDQDSEATALTQLGRAAGMRGEGDQGAELLQRGADLLESLGRQADAVVARGNMVPCLASAGRLREAVEAGHRALDGAQRHRLTSTVHAIRNNLGRCLNFLGEHEAAREMLISNYESSESIHYRVGTTGVLAEFHMQRGEHERAAYWANRGIGHLDTRFKQNPLVVAELHATLALSLNGLGRREQARAVGREALSLLAEIHHREAVQLDRRLRAEVFDDGQGAALGAT